LTTSDGSYLSDKYIIQSSPGLFFSSSNTYVHHTGAALIVSPGSITLDGRAYANLPDADTEIELVAKLLPHSTQLKGTEANFDHVLEKLAQASIFHFAGHAETRMASGELVLNDGTINASTLRDYHLRKNALIVLSACSTGMATGDASRDPYGLVRAFLGAGAQDVIATHWDVDSLASSTFSQNFYPALFLTHNTAAAADKARKAIRANSTMAHPFYWAAFEHFGAAH
jgi:CHAT domain-containing protein